MKVSTNKHIDKKDIIKVWVQEISALKDFLFLTSFSGEPANINSPPLSPP